MPIYKVGNEKKDGLQKYKVKVNYTDSNGRHKQIMRTAYGSQAAKDLERNLLDQIKETLFSPSVSTKMTVHDLHLEYIAYISNEVRRSSTEKKQQIYSHHIQPYLQDVLLSELDTKTLQGWKNYMYQKDFKLQTMKNCYKELRAMINYALRLRYIDLNPLIQVGDFKDAYRGKPEMDFYTAEEFRKYKTELLQFAQESGRYDYYVFFCLAYYTGARKGEIHALRWKNYNGVSISIEKSISQKLTGGDVETPPKTPSSIRKVQLPAPMIEILNEHKQRQQEIISDWNDEGFICGYYKPLRDTQIDLENRKVAQAAELKRIRIHDFRHSHASLLINANINPLEVAHRLGHATVEQTLKTYSHLFPSESDKSLNVLNQI